MPMQPIEFTTRLENFNTSLWSWHVKVPGLIAEAILGNGIKRLVCTLNDAATIHCALMPSGDGGYFILINKKLRDTLKLKEGSPVHARLEADSSEYGMPMPEELAACLADDPAGDRFFHALTPGKQRNLIYAVSQVKDPDKRIGRSLVILDHLKRLEGKLDFKILYADLRGGSSRDPIMGGAP